MEAFPIIIGIIQAVALTLICTGVQRIASVLEKQYKEQSAIRKP